MHKHVVANEVVPAARLEQPEEPAASVGTAAAISVCLVSCPHPPTISLAPSSILLFKLLVLTT